MFHIPYHKVPAELPQAGQIHDDPRPLTGMKQRRDPFARAPHAYDDRCACDECNKAQQEYVDAMEILDRMGILDRSRCEAA